MKNFVRAEIGLEEKPATKSGKLLKRNVTMSQ